MIMPISYIYADLIEASLKTGITYKTFEQVPEKFRNEVKEILNAKDIKI